MPNYLQGDIFAASVEHRSELAIVFGQVDLNEMASHWRDFASTFPELAHVRDPFTELPTEPYQHPDRRWFWFVSARDNHGMTDPEFASALNSALRWAQANGLKRIITNGIANTDLGTDTNANRASHDRRVIFISGLAADHERAAGFEITLISMNDAFVRNRPE